MPQVQQGVVAEVEVVETVIVVVELVVLAEVLVTVLVVVLCVRLVVDVPVIERVDVEVTLVVTSPPPSPMMLESLGMLYMTRQHAPFGYRTIP